MAMNERVMDEIDIKTNDLVVPEVEEPKPIRKKITEADVRRVLKLIELGNSERASCKEVGINHSSFRQGVTRLRVSGEYARATAAMAEQQINLMENILDRLERGQITPEQARIMIDARKWFASKLLPKKYGDKVEHEGNVNVTFLNGVPRPKALDIDATYSVPKQIEPKE